VRNTFVVTTTIRGSSQSRIWDSSRPLTLGNPAHWVVESTRTGVRVRSLARELNHVEAASIQELTFLEISKVKGAEVDLEKFKLRIRPIQGLPAAYESKTGKTLKAYACVGNWVRESISLESTYVAELPNAVAFKLSRKGKEFSLQALLDKLNLNNKELAKNSAISIDEAEIINSVISIGDFHWRFGLVDSHAIPMRPTRASEAAESVVFKKAAAGAAIALAIFLSLSFLWPKTEKTEELVPPQFAKLVMSTTKNETKATQPGSASSATATATKVEKTAIVQAFRAKALQNSLSGLLKGGMTKLLAQSDFASGNSARAESQKMFGSKSENLDNTPNADLNNKKNVAVASLGGSEVAGAKAGYGKGEKAAVKGQGTSQVSMDIGGSSVEEGLTKDEVGEVIHRHLSEVRYCYESAMIRTPDVEGKLIINFVIGAPGSVKTAEVKQSTLPDPRLDDCVLRRLVTWKFPQTKGGVDVAVSYPFIFKSLGR
jgi:TonB family protein